MSCIDDDVVCYVGVHCHLVVLGRRVDGDSSSIVSEVVVGDRQHPCVLDVEVDDADGSVVQHSDAAVLNVVGLERDAWISLADVLEDEPARFISRHRVVSYSLQLSST